jgi:hypothetical protein
MKYAIIIAAVLWFVWHEHQINPHNPFIPRSHQSWR